MENKNDMKGFALRALAVFGFIFIAIVGMFGSVALARAVPGAFSAVASAVASFTSIFVPANEIVSLNIPDTVIAGNPVTASWLHENKSQEGSYTLRYDCPATGVSFTSPTPAGTPLTVFCNTPFNFINVGDTATLTPLSQNADAVMVTMHIDFTPNGAGQPTVSGSKTFAVIPSGGNQGVTNGDNTTEEETPAPPRRSPLTRIAGQETTEIAPFQAPGIIASDPNGVIDLSARVIEVGLVEKSTGTFTASSTPTRSSPFYRVAVRFAVENNGTRTSPQWTFNAVLPTFPAHIFSSKTQQALGPGDRIEFTIAFDSFVDADTGEFIINVDPANKINERNKDNNILTYTVRTVK